mmetsp:Transcript_6846/g.21679  ORF Transcript_6846/g.21679 Transcript_6846/m.21679 type:complete len:255 (-) Transcript_6846:3541-4305(-)
MRQVPPPHRRRRQGARRHWREHSRRVQQVARAVQTQVPLHVCGPVQQRPELAGADEVRCEVEQLPDLAHEAGHSRRAERDRATSVGASVRQCVLRHRQRCEREHSEAAEVDAAGERDSNGSTHGVDVAGGFELMASDLGRQLIGPIHPLVVLRELEEDASHHELGAASHATCVERAEAPRLHSAPLLQHQRSRDDPGASLEGRHQLVVGGRRLLQRIARVAGPQAVERGEVEAVPSTGRHLDCRSHGSLDQLVS